jgi:hypothetical protein
MKIPRTAHSRAAGALIATLALVALAGGCRGINRPESPQADAQEQTTTRLAIDPVASPVPFQWLADDAVLVDPKTPTRKLAGFGNYVSRAAQKVSAGRFSLWDDEAAWKLATEGRDDQEVLSHKRAEYVKDLSPPDPVDRYLVFTQDGMVDYQRDFRSWPLTEMDTID